MMKSFKCLLVACLAAAAVSSAPVEAKETTRQLINVPSPETLPQFAVAVSVAGRQFIPEPDTAADQNLVWGPSIRAGLGLFDRVELGMDAVSAMRSLDHVSAYLKVRLLDEGFLMPAIGVGAFDVTTDKRPNEDIGQPANASDEYRKANKTDNSMYFILAKRIPFVGRAYVGMGRGRFMGRCGVDKDLNGLLLGGEINLPFVNVIGEIDGRTVNAGISSGTPSFPMGTVGIGVNAMVGGKYLPNYRDTSLDQGLRPALFGRLELVITPGPKGPEIVNATAPDMARLPAPPAPKKPALSATVTGTAKPAAKPAVASSTAPTATPTAKQATPAPAVKPTEAPAAKPAAPVPAKATGK